MSTPSNFRASRLGFALLLLLVLSTRCSSICVEYGDVPLVPVDIDCRGSPYSGFCCRTIREAHSNNTACVPGPWQHPACQGGYYAVGPEARACPNGFFCPMNKLCLIKCSPGAYCKQYNTTVETASERCSVQNPGGCCEPYVGSERRIPNTGSNYSIGCGGATTDQPCQEGYYCPGGGEKILCPKSHYCREGSHKPEKCPSLAFCKAGSTAPAFNLFGVVLCVVWACISLIAVPVYKKLNEKFGSQANVEEEMKPLPAFHIPQAMVAVHMASLTPAASVLGNPGSQSSDLQDAEMAPPSSQWVPLFPQQVHHVLNKPHRGRSQHLSPQAKRSRSLSPRPDRTKLLTPHVERGMPLSPQMLNVFSQKPMRKRANTDLGLVEGVRNKLAAFKDLVKPKDYTIHIGFENLKLTLHSNKKTIVNNVSGSIKPAELTAIMGNSGTGKTSFLNCLCGKAYYAERTGVLRINGEEVSGVEEYRNVLGFVPQDDTMHTNLTVHEVLMYQALLRSSRQMAYDKIAEKVRNIEHLLSLHMIRHSIIGSQFSAKKISGGQRKRVNIGMELVAEPSILFLDEPTSGLDSVTSKNVIELLKVIALVGKLTIVMVIHQPQYDIFQQFDNVILMEAGGRIAYQGPVPTAKTFFDSIGYNKCTGQTNPADYYLECVDTRVDQEASKANDGIQKETVADLWEEERKKIPNAPASFPKEKFQPVVRPTMITQFLYMLRRFMLIMLRTRVEFATDLALVAVCGIVLGILFMRSDLLKWQVAHVMAGLALGLTGMITALRPLGTDETRPIFWRESSSGINRLAYFMSITVGHIPIIILYPVFFLGPFYLFTAPRASYQDMYIVLMFTYWACLGAGYFLSVVLHPDNSKMGTIVIALMCAALSGGSSSTICKLQTYTYIGPLAYTMAYSKWYSEAMFELEANAYHPIMAFYVQYNAGFQDYSLTNFAFCLFMLIGIGLAARVLAFLLLIFTHRGEQK